MKRAVDEVTEALEHGRPKRALRLAWDAGLLSASRNDREGLQRVIELADAIHDRAQGRTREEAAALAAYCTHARDNPVLWRSGWAALHGRPRRAPAAVGKLCPECGETIAAADPFCRFCGHRFEPHP